MTDNPDTENTVRRCILEMFLSESAAKTLRNDTDLLDVLDSLQILRLVIELESLFAIKVGDSDLTLDNLGSVAKIAAFIRRKRGEVREELGEPLTQGV
jgi:acyl carrier protein